jgi:hypothetical protein
MEHKILSFLRTDTSDTWKIGRKLRVHVGDIFLLYPLSI